MFQINGFNSEMKKKKRNLIFIDFWYRVMEKIDDFAFFHIQIIYLYFTSIKRMKIIRYFPNFYSFTCNSLISSSFDNLCFVVTGMPCSVNNAPQDLSTGSLIKTLLNLIDILGQKKPWIIFMFANNIHRLIASDIGCNNKIVWFVKV